MEREFYWFSTKQAQTVAFDLIDRKGIEVVLGARRYSEISIIKDYADALPQNTIPVSRHHLGFSIAVDLEHGRCFRFTAHSANLKDAPRLDDVEKVGEFYPRQVVLLRDPLGTRLDYRTGDARIEDGELTLQQAKRLTLLCQQQKLRLPPGLDFSSGCVPAEPKVRKPNAWKRIKPEP